MPCSLLQRCGRIIGLLALVLLQACSAVRLGYTTAPDVGYWWLDSYLDFNDTQAQRVRADLQRLQSWHRLNELPAYLELLQRAQRLAPGEVSAEQMCELFQDAQPRVAALADQVAASMAAIGPGLQPEQLAHLARELDKRSETWRADWLDGTPTERLERRYRQVRDRVESFYGRLDPPQRALLRQGVGASSFDPEEAFRESQRRHTDTLQVLRQMQTAGWSSVRARAEARALLERTLRSPDPDYRAAQERLVQENCRLYAALHATTTAVQRQRAADKLRSYQDDVRALIAERR